MLKAAGISSDAVLIPYTRNLDASVPSPAQFDHVITTVALGTVPVWMDTTTEVAPFRLLASPLRGKSALLVPADGAGRIVETPADPPFVSTQHVDIRRTRERPRQTHGESALRHARRHGTRPPSRVSSHAPGRMETARPDDSVVGRHSRRGDFGQTELILWPRMIPSNSISNSRNRIS